MYKYAKKIQKNIFLNVNIVSLKQDNHSSFNDDFHLAANEPNRGDDESILHDEVICCKAKNVLLSISAVLELAHTSDKVVIPYSMEAALLCSAQMRFHTGKKEYACKYDIFCECCGKIHTKMRAILYQ
jgi:hypothetical protein